MINHSNYNIFYKRVNYDFLESIINFPSNVSWENINISKKI